MEDAHKYVLRSWIAAIRKASAGQNGNPTVSLAAEAQLTALYASVAGISRSQLGQDAFALCFAAQPAGGCFVEVGASNGWDHSNTFMLERYFGWSGLLIDQDGEALAHARTIRTAQIRQARVVAEPLAEGEATLQSLLDDCSLPEDIDYLSIDVDGGELAVLRGLNLSRRNIATVSIMHDFDEHKLLELDAMLAPFGYQRVLPNASDADAYYVRRPVWRRWLSMRLNLLAPTMPSPPPSAVHGSSSTTVTTARVSSEVADYGTAIFLAGGIGTRWGNHGGTSKHLMRVHPDAPSVIERLVAQFTTLLPNWRHLVMSSDAAVQEAVERYGPEVMVPSSLSLNCDKFLSSRSLWDRQRPVLFVYGDCFLSHGVASLMAHGTPSGTTFFGSKIFAELFGAYVAPDGLDDFETACDQVAALERAGQTAGGGWRILRHLSSLPCEPADGDVTGPLAAPFYFDCHDGMSRDFDYPADLDSWRSSLAWAHLRALNEA